MAKHLVLNVLQNVLSDFLEIDEKNFDLNLAVWSGSIRLHDVKLKTDKLFRSFNLSFVNGVVKTLEVHIPWTALLNSPVRINIDGCYLQVCPLNVSSLDKEQTRNRLRIMKQEKISFADKFIDFSKGGEGEDSAGDDSSDDDDDDDDDAEARRKKRAAKKEGEKSWIQVWTSKIVDNLEITLKNIHIRYEDDSHLNGSTNSAGVTLSKFAFTTCDENWKTSFVARHGEPIRKLIKVENFGVYWNMQSQSLASLSKEEWEKAMHDIIFKNEDFRHNDYEESVDMAKKVEFVRQQTVADGSKSVPGSMKYIVAPTNKLEVKALHNDHLITPGDTPKYEVSILNEELDLSLDGLQYKQLSQTMEMIGVAEAMKQPYMYRPTARPSGKDNCRRWWRYACKLAVKRPHYIRLVKLSKTVNPMNKFENLLTADDKIEMDALEERLSLQTIIVFRHSAAEEMAREADEARREARRRNQNSTGGGGGGGHKPKVIAQRTWWGFIKGEPKPGERTRNKSPRVDAAGIDNDDEEGFGSWDNYQDNDESYDDQDDQGHIARARSRSHGRVSDDDNDDDKSDDDDIAIDKIIDSLDEHNKRRIEKNRSHNTLLSLSMKSSARLELSQYGVPVLSATMSLTAAARVTHLGVQVVLDLGDMCARDRITPNAVLPNLVSVKSTSEGEKSRLALLEGAGTWQSVTSLRDESLDSQRGFGATPHHSKRAAAADDGDETKKPSFTVIFERANDDKKSLVRIASLPLEIALNKLCVQHIIGIFFYPKPPPPGKTQAEAEAHERRRRALDREALLKATSGIGSSSAAAAAPPPPPQSDAASGEKKKDAAAAQQEHTFELIFEAHAPKIIIPEESSSDKGYLLLDTGFLKVRGLVGPEGMEWDLSLNSINAGMPLCSQDMYNLETLSDLYLIKPFDIGCQIQNIDKSKADMNVDLTIAPEFRGELSAKKLDRLLKTLQVASVTLFQKPTFDLPGMEALKELDRPPLYMKAREAAAKRNACGRNLESAFDTSPRLSPSGGGSSSNSAAAAAAGGSGFSSSASTSSSVFSPHKQLSLIREQEYENELVEEGNSSEIKSLIRVMDDSAEEQEVRGRDPLVAGLWLTIKIPKVALDLSYDDLGHHSVFEVTDLEMELINRPHDLSVELDFGGLSIRDSMRSEAQQYLASTPSLTSNDDDDVNKGKSRFVHIRYVNIVNRLSPFFKAHGAELTVEFANLHLNIDVMTLMHLRPFIIVLLHNKRDKPHQQQQGGGTNNNNANSNNAANPPPPGVLVDNSHIPVTQKPFGMHMVFSMKNLTVDIMRVGEDLNGREEQQQQQQQSSSNNTLKLDPTFSLQIFDLRADIDNRGLMRANVQLRSAEIIDIRAISRDYALKKVFGPMASEHANADPDSEAEEVPAAPAGGDGPTDIIRLWFNQESAEQSQLEVLVSNASTYASTDTFLDLSNVALGNFQAFLHLLSAPPNSSPRGGGLLSSSARSSQADLRAHCSKKDSDDDDDDGDDNEEGGLFVDVPDSGKYRQQNVEQPVDLTMPPAAPSLTDERERMIVNAGEDSDAVSEERPIGADPVRQTLVIKATVKNPRVCLLDDPTSESSPAIVGTCGLELYMTRDLRIDEWLDKRDLRESLHMSIKDLQVFTLKKLGARNSLPRAILQPMGIEFNMRRESFNGQLLSSSISIDTDNANARVTLNDLVLAKSVFTRGNTSEADLQEKQAQEALLQQHQMYQLQQQSEYQLRQEPLQVNNSSLTNHTFTFNLGTISLVALNDFQGQNTPVMRMLIDEAKFCIARGQGLLFGDGDFIASADFYNHRLNLWEPILDRWHPTMQIVTENGEVQYNIKSDLTLQMTVSGIMLETLMQSYSLLVSLTKDEEEPEQEGNNAGESETATADGTEGKEKGNNKMGIGGELMVDNQLGYPIELEVVDSSNSELVLLSLSHGEKGDLKPIADPSRKCAPGGSLPTAVDIKFKGAFAEQRSGLYNLPLTSSKPRLYHLMPTHLPLEAAVEKEESNSSAATVGVDSADNAVRPESHRMVLIEPIEEETFEYARYEPLSNKWIKPFLAGDPYEWSDANGNDKRPISSIGLGSDRWEWQYPKWQKCMRGKVGVEIDEDGWEYSTSFNNFSMTNKRRSYKNLDSCRRRKWINARVPKAGSVADKLRPLNVHWDVQVRSDGSKIATLRSGLQIRNDLPYPVEIILTYVSWESDQQLGPLAEGELFDVPLLCSYASSIMIRPANVPYSWTTTIPCAIQTYDYIDHHDLRCESESLTPLYVRASVAQTAKSVMVSLSSYMVIKNRLPCDVRFRMGYSSRDLRQETGEVRCGDSFKLAYMDYSERPSLSICIGEHFNWSRAVPIETSANEGAGGTRSRRSSSNSRRSGKDESDVRLVELPSSKPMTVENDGVDNGVVVAMQVSLENNSVTIELFSKYLFIDHTGLGLAILSTKRYGLEMLRQTHSRASLASTSSGRDSRSASILSGSSSTRSRGLSLTSVPSAGTSPEKEGRSSSRDDDDTWRDSTSSPLKTDLEDAKSLVTDLEVDSDHQYEVCTVSVNDFTYTDRKYRWTYLPEELRGATCIRTPYGDKLRRSRLMVSFRVTRPSFLVVLADSRKMIKWLREDGFEDLVEHAIAMRVIRGATQEVYFTIHGKYCPAGSVAELRGNYSKAITAMYTVFLVEAPEHAMPEAGALTMLSQIQFASTYDRSLPNRCWLDGGEGLAMFYTGDDSVKVGVSKQFAGDAGAANSGKGSSMSQAAANRRGSVGRRTSIVALGKSLGRDDFNFSDEIRISMARVQHSGSFEVVDWDSRVAYQLAYRMRLMPGVYKYTQEVTVVPQFCVVNLMEEEIMIRQTGTKTETTYFPYRPEGWHKSDYDFDCIVQIGCKSSLFSLGTIDLSEVGSSTLLVQRRDDSSDGDKAIVLHVEVKVARPEERCGVVVVVWRSTQDNYSTLSIMNETDVHITVMQDIREKYKVLFEKNKSYKNLFQVCVAPNSTVPFGWADPDMEGVVNVTIGKSIDPDDSTQRVASISMLRTGMLVRLSDGVMRQDRSSFGEVVLSVQAINGSRVLRCTRPQPSHLAPLSNSSISNKTSPGQLVSTKIPSGGQGSNPTAFAVNFTLASFGVSLVVEKPVRREMLSLYVDGLLLRSGNNVAERQSFYELSIANAQVDNYSESAIHPVLIYDLRDNNGDSSPSAREEAEGEGEGGVNIQDIPLLSFTIIREMPPPSKDGTGTMSIVKYIGCRLMPMAFQVDSATIQLLYTDLLNDLKYVTKEQTVASSAPSKWMNDRNLFLVGAESKSMVDVYESKTIVALSKMYVETMELHPMKFRVTFVQTPFPRKGSMNVTLHSTFMNIVTSLVGIEKMELKLKSFRVSDALESTQSLRSAVVQKTWQDIKGQLGSVLGSMAAFGSPLGFAKKIGGGVSDLFYEPYQGAMHSPVDFISGVGKGTASLASNVVGGVFSSVGSIAGTASKGIGYLSGDGDYVRRRALKKQRLRAQGGGFFDGLIDGGDSIASGISSGLSGLITRPVEEAQKSGARGFMKGVGLGILGAVVKPIMGVTDAVTGVATGISNQVNSELVAIRVRPVRAMLRSERDAAVLVIGPMSVQAADAQDMIVRRAKEQKFDDHYIDMVFLDVRKQECFIITETYIYWKHGNERLWGRVWANVSHVLFYGDTVGVYLYTGSANGTGTANKVVEVPCGTQELAMQLYGVLARNAFRMGNPSNVVPVETVKQLTLTLSNAQFRQQNLADPHHTFSLDNTLDGYLFGCNNNPKAHLGAPRVSESKLKAWLTAEMLKPVTSWSALDKVVWKYICLWDTSHRGIQASRACLLTIINRSDSPVQIARISLEYGAEVELFGSMVTGYEAESRCVMPGGACVVFTCAHHPSPIEVGHVMAKIDCPSFSATIASTQRESCCASKGAFSVGFLEKNVAEWYAKYCLCIS